MTMPRKYKSICALGSLGLLALALTGCQPEAPVAAPQISRPVKVAVVAKERSGFKRSYPGKVRADREAKLSFRVPGTLVDLPVKAGQEVKKGQVIARLDPRDFKINLEKAEAFFREAEHQYKRYQALLERKVVAQSAFDAVHRQYLTTKAAYDTAKSALADTTLVAPFAGTVANTLVDNHQDVQAKQPVISLQDVSRLEVEVQVPEQDVVPHKGPQDFKLTVVLESMPGVKLPAKVKEFSTEADPVTQTFTARVVVETPKGFTMLPGMTADLLVREIDPARNSEEGLVVPVQSVAVDQAKRSFVWRIDCQTKTAHRVPVKLGTIGSEGILVRSSLLPGQVVATAGVHHLREGMPVRFMNLNEKQCTK